MGYKITKWSGIHSEGTKFYQVYAISNEASGVAYCVTHWGLLSSSFSDWAEICPVKVGARKLTQIATRSLLWEAARHKNGKTKRGYVFRAEASLAEDFPDESLFLLKLYSLFNRGDANSILSTIKAGLKAEGDGTKSSISATDKFVAELDAGKTQEEVSFATDLRRKVAEFMGKPEPEPQRANALWGTW